MGLALPNQTVANLAVSGADTTALLQAQHARQKDVAMSKLGIAKVRKKFQDEIDTLTAEHEKAETAVNEAQAAWEKAANTYEQQILNASPYASLAAELGKFNIPFTHRGIAKVVAEGKKLASIQITYTLRSGEYRSYGPTSYAVDLAVDQPHTSMPAILSGPHQNLQNAKQERATILKKLEQITLKRDRLWQMEETALLEIDRKTFFTSKESQQDLDTLAAFIEANV